MKKNDVHKQKYYAHIEMFGEKVIPGNSFEIDGREFVLLKIIIDSFGGVFLKLLQVSGEGMGTIFLVPKKELEEKDISELSRTLSYYKHN